MEISIGNATNLVSQVATYVFLQIKRPISYVFHHERRVENFEEKVNSLKETRERVQHAVDAAERNSEKIETDVTNWLINVDKIINEEAKEVKDLEDKAKNKCFIGLCPNFKSRYQLSKKAEEDAKAVDELFKQGGFDKVSYLDPPQAIVDASPKEFEAFDSRKQVFNEVLEAVKDPSINIIGVYGMAGVGKTTFVNEVGRQVRVDKLFNSVVTAVVTQNPDIQKLQDQIADMLGLIFKEQSLIGRASRLCERLKKEEKILVVLDDIWARLDLMKEVGIPTGNEHKGCTILLTSRDLFVLSNCMDAQKSFQIGVLTEEEAWDLFKKMAGDIVESPDLRSIATEVATKCACLPIAISTVARALRNKSSFAWRDALRQLQKPSSSNFRGVPADAYSAIELSYNHLESEELRETFLLCSLLGHNASIQDLLKYTMGLGLFHVSTIEEARDRLLTVVSNLKTSCLLLDSYTNQHVDMHDLVCDVAISIASRDNHVFALKHEEVMKDWPDGETMKIVLDYASISKLPDQLKCPKLTLFHIESKDPSMEVPNNFFKEMTNLKVLDMTNMHFLALPSSVSLLSNLQTLCLDQCVLGDIAIIGELKNLEILGFLMSDIEMLPKEIGQLIKLKLLDLTDCTKLKIIPAGLLSSLSALEELYMGNSFVHWEAEGHSQPSNASLVELKALSCLSTLDVHILDAHIIPKDLFFEKLQRYKIFIGEAWDWDGKIEYSRTLKLRLTTGIGFLNYGMKMLLRQVENLHLDEMTGVEILLHELEDRECFQQLKNLHIQNGALIQFIIKDDNVADKIEFPQLQSLTLQDLPNLISFCSKNKGLTSITPRDPHDLSLFNEKIVFPKLENLKLSSINIERIWHYQLPRGSANYSIQNLTSLMIEGCDNLKHVLSYSMAKCLQQLKSFEIIECNAIQGIIAMEEIKDDGNRATISFPRLDSLKLRGLQKLIGFCHGDYILEFPSLKILQIKQCPELKGFINKSMSNDITVGTTNDVLFNEQVAFPNMEKMIISHLRNVKRIWYNQLHADSFCKLKELKAEYCDELLNIFPSFVLRIFQKLEILKVTDCVSLEEVFELQVPGLDIKDTCVVAIQLRELYLYRLPKLKHVWNKDPHENISFQNLRKVDVLKCWNLKSLFPFSIAKGLAQLESLEVDSSGVEETVSKNEGLDQEIWFEFPRLSFLNLWYVPNLKYFYPGKHNTVWPVLKKLKTYRCEKFKIFGTLNSQIQQPLFLIEKVIPQLEEVMFNSDDIAMICDSQFASDFFFHIKVLHVTRYINESTVFPIHFLQRFYNLESLNIFSCYFEELSPYKGDVGEEKDLWTLPKIKKLRLDFLYRIEHLWKQDSLLDYICASLETLEVRRCESLLNLGSSSASFQSLTTLDVWNCKGMGELITSSKAQSLVRLVTMRIRECEMMKELVANDGDGDLINEIIFRDLKCLELHCLPSLRNFCSGNYAFKFPSLEQVILSQCPSLKYFCNGALSTPKLQRVQLKETNYKGRWAGDLNATIKQLQEEKVGFHGLKLLKLSMFPELMDIWSRNPQKFVEFKNLTALIIEGCGNLKHVLSYSMAQCLQQLESFEIIQCNGIQEIIAMEEIKNDGKRATISFPRLNSLIIKGLQKLIGFCHEDYTLEFPSLKVIQIEQCPKLKGFINNDLTAVTTNEALFNEQVAFPNLEKMIISHLRNVKRIWYNQLHADSFCKLKELKAEYCDELLNIFPSFILGVFQRLEILRVIACVSLEEVFELQVPGLDIKDTCVVAIQLRELYLYCLPKLKHVWNKDPHGNISFQNLQKVVAWECWGLKSLFPFSIAKGLAQLESLEVTSCGVEEIVSKNEGLDQEIWLEFPQLSLFELWYVPDLKYFYPGKHKTMWPVLKRLRTYRCEKFKIFGTLNSQIQQPLFLIEKVIPQLEEATFSSDDIAMICDSQFASDFFFHIKVLRVTRYINESIVFPIHFLQRFYNLESLNLFSCYFKELSPYEGDVGEEKDLWTLPKLKRLQLDFLHRIGHLWKRDSLLDHICASLETLEVWRCESLINLGSSSASFQSLTTLDVWKCNGMGELITSSKAQSLVRLVTMRIRECEMMKEVVASEGDGDSTNEIIFRELKCLELHCLQSLKNFCSGNYTFKFPSLEKVILSQCPSLKSFCHGALSTPKLQRVQLEKTNYKEGWSSDLNATVQQLYTEQNVQISEEKTEYSI